MDKKCVFCNSKEVEFIMTIKGEKSYFCKCCHHYFKLKEERTMHDSITVSCRGFTGTLETLLKGETGYNLSIRDTENSVTHVLENVKPNEIKLVSGRVTMGG